MFGSDLHRVAYPDRYRKHLERDSELKEAYEHPGTVLDVQLRGRQIAMGVADDIGHSFSGRHDHRVNNALVQGTSVAYRLDEGAGRSQHPWLAWYG